MVQNPKNLGGWSCWHRAFTYNEHNGRHRVGRERYRAIRLHLQRAVIVRDCVRARTASWVAD